MEHSSLLILYVNLSDASYYKLINWYLTQVIYPGAGNRTTSDAAILLKPNSSIQFTGQADILAQLKEYFTAKTNDKLHL